MQAVEEGGLIFREPYLAPQDPDATWTLRQIVDQLRACGFQCEAGPLTMNVAFIALERMSAQVEEGGETDEELARHLRSTRAAARLRKRGWHIAIFK